MGSTSLEGNPFYRPCARTTEIPMDLKHRQREVERQRKQKDSFFRTSHHSPIPGKERITFRGLNYYPYDPSLVFELELRELPDAEDVVMATSVDGREVIYNKVGLFEFEVGSQVLRLYAYRSAHEHDQGPPTLFIPFRDRTSGKETYGAGRYLDLEVSPYERYVLDFNLAYNPYCAYSNHYVCPLPPPENWLEVEIPAGEKNYLVKA